MGTNLDFKAIWKWVAIWFKETNVFVFTHPLTYLNDATFTNQTLWYICSQFFFFLFQVLHSKIPHANITKKKWREQKETGKTWTSNSLSIKTSFVTASFSGFFIKTFCTKSLFTPYSSTFLPIQILYLCPQTTFLLIEGEGCFAIFDRITFFSKHASTAEKVAKEWWKWNFSLKMFIKHFLT